MRFLMVFVVVSAGLRAQQKAEEVKREEVKREPPKVCSIPLIVVKPAPVDSKMVIQPKEGVRYQMREVIPPAPACESVRWK